MMKYTYRKNDLFLMKESGETTYDRYLQYVKTILNLYLWCSFLLYIFRTEMCSESDPDPLHWSTTVSYISTNVSFFGSDTKRHWSHLSLWTRAFNFTKAQRNLPKYHNWKPWLFSLQNPLSSGLFTRMTFHYEPLSPADRAARCTGEHAQFAPSLT